MNEGKVKKALKILSNATTGGILKLDEVVNDSNAEKTVRDIIREKHPDSKQAIAESILHKDDSSSLPCSFLFENISGDEIRQAVLRTDGAAGPLGLDLTVWKRLCTAFGDASNELCKAVAVLAKKLCTSFIDPQTIEAYNASRLIPLNKCPGVRPIGIGEVLRRIIAKVIMKVVKPELQEVVGSLQLCVGQISGLEAAIHSLTAIYEDSNTDAILLIDASNAFNTLNRQAALLNCEVLCPTLAPILINTYREPPLLFTDGECMLSKEGTTQGDPLAMAMYAIGTLPLIKRLGSIVKQIWYADDSAAGSTLDNLKSWWLKLNEIGPQYGYYINPKKSVLLVKESKLDEAKVIFEDQGVCIQSEGTRYLGGAIGEHLLWTGCG